MSRPKAAHPLLERSQAQGDNKEYVGRDPRTLSPDVLAPWHKALNPYKVIRARCRDCCAGFDAEIKKCVMWDCVNWPYRMGTNPFRKKQSAEQRAASAARLAKARERS